MQRLVTPSFLRASKKLHPQQKAALDQAVRTISAAPGIDEAKVGDLLGVRVYKFRLSFRSIAGPPQDDSTPLAGLLRSSRLGGTNLPLCLWVYRYLDEDSLKLLTFGPHDNFYRDMKRLDD
jgi:mRNA interferase RelE/StbE